MKKAWILIKFIIAFVVAYIIAVLALSAMGKSVPDSLTELVKWIFGGELLLTAVIKVFKTVKKKDGEEEQI